MINERKGLGIGLLAGLFVGIVFDNIALGIIFGLFIGAAYDKKKSAGSDQTD